MSRGRSSSSPTRSTGPQPRCPSTGGLRGAGTAGLRLERGSPCVRTAPPFALLADSRAPPSPLARLVRYLDYSFFEHKVCDRLRAVWGAWAKRGGLFLLACAPCLCTLLVLIPFPFLCPLPLQIHWFSIFNSFIMVMVRRLAGEAGTRREGWGLLSKGCSRLERRRGKGGERGGRGDQEDSLWLLWIFAFPAAHMLSTCAFPFLNPAHSS